MAISFGPDFSHGDLDALTRQVRGRAASELTDDDCRDLSAQMVMDALIAYQTSNLPFEALVNMNAARRRYYTRARANVRRNRSASEVSDLRHAVATPLMSQSAFADSDHARREGASRSLSAAGVDMDPMDAVAVRDLVSRLPHPQREAIVLRSWNYTFEEIGTLTDTSTATAHRNYKRACEAMQAALTQAEAA